jgi:two-component system nitrogen regulation sensor histidine kinase NtrY
MTTKAQTGLGGAEAAVIPALSGRGGRSPALFAAGFIVAAALAAGTSFMAVYGVGPFSPASPMVLWLLCLSLAITAFLAGVVALRIRRIARARKTPETGARLHLRFVLLFSFAAVIPAVIVAGFLGAALNRGVDQWFSDRFRSLVENAATVGKSYVDAAKESTRGEVLAMAQDLNRAAVGLTADKAGYAEYLRNQAQLRYFQSAYVIDGQGKILAAAESEEAAPFSAPPRQAFIDSQRVVWMDFRPNDTIVALYHLKDYREAYLFVTSPVDKGIFAKLQQFDSSVNDYRALEKQSAQLRSVIALSYFVTALLVLLGAVWLGLTNASRISEPIGKLADAARRVSDGDLDAHVATTGDRDEVDELGRAFNAMTGQLQAQHDDLVRARTEAERRSGFIGAVLSGVSAGVLGLDTNGRITAANRSASLLLDAPQDELIGRRLVDVAPEFAEIMNLPPLSASETVQRRIDLASVTGVLHLRVRVGADPTGAGMVLTFDDETKLIAAQRQEAWKDVARRIAHEIKNPLTPIQLSAERLKRKYESQISDDRDTFQKCIETIMRQVNDIRRMVDEFSAFARMPTPTMEPGDLSAIAQETAFAQRIAFPDVRFEVTGAEKPRVVLCDSRLIAQALTNLTKNAAEAIGARREKDGEPKDALVLMKLSDAGASVAIEVIDNGIGFPPERARLVEPYVTTRVKGAGLGLAIVQRVIEDHGGTLELDDAPGPGPGALVRVQLPKQHQDAAFAQAHQAESI